MSKVYLINTVGNISYDNKITLGSGKPEYYSTKPASKGRWYYEYTHLQGSRKVLCGFSINNVTSTKFYIGEWPESFYIYYGESVSVYNASDKSIKINLYDKTGSMLNNLPEKYTIGLGYDTYSRLFTIYYNTKVLYYYIKCEEIFQKVTPVFSENTGDTYEDTISVNFDGPFDYGLPQGYLQWGTYLQQKTCSNENYHVLPHFAMLIFILFHDS